jgi:hypothetical protein
MAGPAFTSDESIPFNQGADGDYHLVPSTGDLFKRIAGQWTFLLKIKGSSVLHGASDPVNGTEETPGEGNAGDFYINTSTHTLFGPKDPPFWGPGTSLIGPKGDAGVAGPPGSAGPQGGIGLTGAAGPQGPMGLTGDAGPTGMAGPQGPQGENGPSGRTILHGYGVPDDSLGEDGDFYIDLIARQFYGPKVGVWPGPPFDMVGATGENGAAGARWRLLYEVPEFPVPEGNVGDFLLNPLTGDYYILVQSFGGRFYSLVGTLTGPQGIQGEPGVQGEAGPAGPQGIQGIPGSWPTRLEPQGDLSMGEFTQGYTP